MNPASPVRPVAIALLAAAASGCAHHQNEGTSDIQAPPGPPPQMNGEVIDHDHRMAWWRDARFGMFIHWGVYSVPAGTWNGRTTGGSSEWLMQSLKVPTTEYITFADGFTAAKYDPRAWAALARRAGMKYVVITSRHHDGFCLWDSAVSGWDIMASPADRDLLAPLAAAVREEGLHFGLYYSILDWRHPDYQPARPWNTLPEWNGGPGYAPDFRGRFVPYVHAQVAEIIRNYQPSVLWFDGEWEDTWTAPMGDALYQHVRTLQPDIIVNNRVGKSRNDMAGFTREGAAAQGDFCTPEQEVPATGMPGVDWETCMTMNNSWGYKAGDHGFKSAAQIVRTLCDIASKGGNFLLNIGPMPDGTIPPESVERLEQVGRWMDLNGDAIYGTTASPFKKLDWGRATQKGTTLNLLVFKWPTNPTRSLELPGLKNRITSVRVVAPDRMMRSPQASTSDAGATLHRLGVRPAGIDPDMPVLIQVEFDGPLHVVTPAAAPIRLDTSNAYTLPAAKAEIDGRTLRLQGEGAGNENLGYWTNAADKAAWIISPLRAGDYHVELDLACQPADAGCPFEVAVGDGVVKGVVPDTGSWDTFKTVSLDGLRVNQSATTGRVEVRPAGTLKGGLMNLKCVRLFPPTN